MSTARRLHTLMLMGALGASACGTPESGPGSAPREREALDVRIARAESREMDDPVEIGGIVRAAESATLASRVMAPVVGVEVSPGDVVRRGAILVRLDEAAPVADAERATAQVTAAERAVDAARAGRDAAAGALALAKASHGRVAALHARRSATAQELDQAVAALTTADSHAAGAAAKVEEAAAALASARAAAASAATAAAYTRIAAPFDGIVTEKLVEPGNLATPGLPLVRLDRTGPMRVDVHLDESMAAAVAVGAGVVIEVPPAPGGPPEARRLDARVIEIARAVDVGSRAVLVKIGLPDAERLASGTFVRVRFSGTPRQTVAVPVSALQWRGQMASVFVLDAQVARRRLVRPGIQQDGFVELRAGLDADEQVIVEPSPALADGHPVRVAGGGSR